MIILRHIPNLLTSCNLLTGLIGIITVFQGNHHLAIYYVIVAGVFDFFDGFAARLLGVKSEIGKELDSLADMVSFAVLPTVYIFTQLQLSGFHNVSYFALTIAVFSALRLAKFNIDEGQSDKFIGLPTPANAIALTSLVFLPFQLSELIWIIVIAASCLMMVAKIELLALKFNDYSIKNNAMKYSVLIVIILLMIINGISGLVFAIPVYIFVSILANLFKTKISTE